jgi:hypothetical protein
MNAKQLLADIAHRLWLEAERNAIPIIEVGRRDAAPDRFIGAYAYAQFLQGATTRALFHLPEPILSPRDRPRILVVGVNPGYGIGEQMPTLDWSPDRYISFYWDRFEEIGVSRESPASGASPQRIPPEI